MFTAPPPNLAEARLIGLVHGSPLDLNSLAAQHVGIMELPDDEQIFLRDLVKSARQKPHYVTWKDRDGSERHTTLSQSEVVRLNTIAAKLGVAKAEVLRRAAHVPVAQQKSRKTEN